jgi:hypothetical protein
MSALIAGGAGCSGSPVMRGGEEHVPEDEIVQLDPSTRAPALAGWLDCLRHAPVIVTC